MSAHSQFPSPGPNEWVEQLRETMKHEPPTSNEAILDAAYEAGEYEASEMDTATLFDYCQGRLSPEQRREVEAEIMTSPHALRKLARIGAIVARDCNGALHAPERIASPAKKTASEPSLAPPPFPVSRTRLGPPQASLGDSQPRREDCLPLSPDSGCEVYRSLEKNHDQLRIYHPSAPVGTLLRIRMANADTEANPSANPATQFVVLRRGSASTTSATTTIPESFERGEVDLELAPIPPERLSAEDASRLLQSFENASEDDPVSVTPLHEPRSAWQIWADGILAASGDETASAIRDVAEWISVS